MTRKLVATGNLVNPNRDPDDPGGDPDEVPQDPRLLDIAARITEQLARLGLSARELSRRSGLADTHVNLAIRTLEKGKTINVTTLLAIADGAKVDPCWLLTGRGGGTRLRDVPGWSDVLRATLARYRDVPDFAIAQVGEFMFPVPPDRLEPASVVQLARAWFDAASDELRSGVETAYVRSKTGQKKPR